MLSTQTPAKSAACLELAITNFGLLDSRHLDPSKQYAGYLYKLSPEVCRLLCEALSFSAKFELPAIRSACIDIFKAEGWIVLEIERNTKPADISVRYSRDRWQMQAVLAKGPDGLRPWIKSVYTASNLDEQTLLSIAQTLAIDSDDLAAFYVRLNLKEGTGGLIVAKDAGARVPDGAFLSFSLDEHAPCPAADSPDEQLADQLDSRSCVDTTHGAPTDQLPRESESEMSERMPYVSTGVAAGEAKYATYSRSEVDYLLKQQAESIMNALSGKISAQQRAFQEAVASQEKTFNKLSDSYLAQFESSRVKLENTAKSAQENTKSELAEFHKLLAKELEQHRTQINKTVLPVVKALDGKALPQPKEAPAKPAANVPAKAQQVLAAGQNKLEKLVTATLVLSLLSAVVSAMALLQRVH